MKKLLSILCVLFITGCAIGILDEPKAGMTFNSDIWADRLENGRPTNDRNPFYLYVGDTKKGVLYKKNPRLLRSQDQFNGGIIVSKNVIVEVVNLNDIKNYEAEIKSRVPAVAATNQTRKQESPKPNNTRELARNDVVAQVLTYSIGMPENATGSAYFYPVNNKSGACVYKLEVDKSDKMMSFGFDYLNQLQGSLNAMGLGSMVNPGQQANWYSGEFDLNKFNIKNVKFYQVQSTQRNRSGSTANLSYKTQVEGLTEFECDSTLCSIDRLRNGWRVLATKCKGTAKAF